MKKRGIFQRALVEKGGFTLIELLVVIAIIGLLSSIVTTRIASARMQSRDAKRLSDIQSIKTALALDYDAKGSYLSSGYMSGNLTPGSDCGMPNNRNVTEWYCSSATSPVNGHWIYNRTGRNLGAYMAKDPVPPSRNTYGLPYGSYYYYAWDTAGSYDSQFYMLIYNLEGIKGGKKTEAHATSGAWIDPNSGYGPNGMYANFGYWFNNDYVFTTGHSYD